jgi:hypothetical protein
MDHLNWQYYFGETSATVTEYVLAMATLGSVTRNRNNPICVVPPKVAKARTMVSVTCCSRWHYRDKLRQCKHTFIRKDCTAKAVVNY